MPSPFQQPLIPLVFCAPIAALQFPLVSPGAIMHPPGHGAVAPLTAGVTLFACLSAGEYPTGIPRDQSLVWGEHNRRLRLV